MLYRISAIQNSNVAHNVCTSIPVHMSVRYHYDHYCAVYYTLYHQYCVLVYTEHYMILGAYCLLHTMLPDVHMCSRLVVILLVLGVLVSCVLLMLLQAYISMLHMCIIYVYPCLLCVLVSRSNNKYRRTGTVYQYTIIVYSTLCN